jgi:chromosomal replication initiation ATPase DnaA
MGAAAPTSPALFPAPVVIERVAEHFGVAVVDLRGPRVARSLGFARHVAALLLHDHTVMSDAEVAVALGRTGGAATAMLRAARARLQDQRFSGAIEQVRERLLQGDHV